jgi:hypothetical protein
MQAEHRRATRPWVKSQARIIALALPAIVVSLLISLQ